MFERGDLVEVIAINPSDLPSPHLSSFVGRIGVVTHVMFSHPIELRSIGSIEVRFDENECEIFYPSADKLRVLSRDPDWVL